MGRVQEFPHWSKQVGCRNPKSPHCPSKQGAEIKQKWKKLKIKKVFQ
jgi:hypothetical protein